MHFNNDVFILNECEKSTEFTFEGFPLKMDIGR